MLITVEIFLSPWAFFTAIKVIKNDEICVRVAFLPHKHLTMTDQTASRPTYTILRIYYPPHKKNTEFI